MSKPADYLIDIVVNCHIRYVKDAIHDIYLQFKKIEKYVISWLRLTTHIQIRNRAIENITYL